MLHSPVCPVYDGGGWLSFLRGGVAWWWQALIMGGVLVWVVSGSLALLLLRWGGCGSSGVVVLQCLQLLRWGRVGELVWIVLEWELWGGSAGV